MGFIWQCLEPCNFHTSIQKYWQKHLKEKHENESCCNAMLYFDNTNGKFVTCEKWKNHEGNHRGLAFEWEELEQHAHSSYLHRHTALLKAKIQKFINGENSL